MNPQHGQMQVQACQSMPMCAWRRDTVNVIYKLCLRHFCTTCFQLLTNNNLALFRLLGLVEIHFLSLYCLPLQIDSLYSYWSCHYMSLLTKCKKNIQSKLFKFIQNIAEREDEYEMVGMAGGLHQDLADFAKSGDFAMSKLVNIWCLWVIQKV